MGMHEYTLCRGFSWKQPLEESIERQIFMPPLCIVMFTELVNVCVFLSDARIYPLQGLLLEAAPEESIERQIFMPPLLYSYVYRACQCLCFPVRCTNIPFA